MDRNEETCWTDTTGTVINLWLESEKEFFIITSLCDQQFFHFSGIEQNPFIYLFLLIVPAGRLFKSFFFFLSE